MSKVPRVCFRLLFMISRVDATSQNVFKAKLKMNHSSSLPKTQNRWSSNKNLRIVCCSSTTTAFPHTQKKKRSVQVFFKQLNYLEPLKTCSVLRIDVVVRHYVVHTAYGLLQVTLISSLILYRNVWVYWLEDVCLSYLILSVNNSTVLLIYWTEQLNFYLYDVRNIITGMYL